MAHFSSTLNATETQLPHLALQHVSAQLAVDQRVRLTTSDLLMTGLYETCPFEGGPGTASLSQPRLCILSEGRPLSGVRQASRNG